MPALPRPRCRRWRRSTATPAATGGRRARWSRPSGRCRRLGDRRSSPASRPSDDLSISARRVRPPGDHPPRRTDVKYMMLIHQLDAPRPRRDGETNEAAVAAYEALSPDEQRQIWADYAAVSQSPGVTPGVELAPAETATTVRVQDGRALTTDGPFAETKEAFGGYLIYEADDLDAAIELASR